MKLTLATLFICTVPFLLAQESTSSATTSEPTSARSVQDEGAARLLVSTSPNREDARPLEGTSLSGEVYIFFEPLGSDAESVEEVAFYLNDSRALSPLQIEAVAPFDFAGSKERDAYPFNVDDLGRRENVVSAKVTLRSGERKTLSAAFVAESVQEAFKADYYVATDGSDEG